MLWALVAVYVWAGLGYAAGYVIWAGPQRLGVALLLVALWPLTVVALIGRALIADPD